MRISEIVGKESQRKIWLLYLRKSRQDDPKETVEEVLAKHEEQLQEWAERELGGRIPEENIYREIGSGESIDARVAIKEVLARLEDPAVGGVIVMEPSRLSRGDLADCSKIIDSFRFSHSLVATPYMTYNLENKMERKFFKDELLRGNDYLEYTKEILFRGRVAAAKRGCFIGNHPPYGYKKVVIGKDHTLEIIEDQAEAVRLAYNMYVKEGKTPYQIACRLNEMGVKPARIDKWKKDSVRVMLRNPHYAGYIAFNQKKFTPVLENGEIIKRRLAQPVEDIIISEGKHSEIVDRALWEEAQEIIAKNPRVNQFTDLKNPLATVLFCKKCGRNMALHPYKHAENRYTCKERPPCYKSAKASALMEALVVALEEAELPALELKVKNGDGDARRIQQRLLEKLEKQMADYRDQEERQYELLETNPNYSQEVFNRRNRILRERMDECQAAIYKAKSALPQSVDYAERVVALKAAIDILRDPEATPADQNKVVKAIIERVEYSSIPSDKENRKRLRGGEISPFELHIMLRL
jgi:hypothetical protein